jgi:hypothetical protein
MVPLIPRPHVVTTTAGGWTGAGLGTARRPLYDGCLLSAPTRRQALTAENLGDLNQGLVRTLCQMLIMEQGFRATRVQPRDRQEDIYFQIPLAWRGGEGIVRVLHRPLEPGDAKGLGDVARASALADAVLVEAQFGDATVEQDPAVQVIRASQLVEAIRASALIDWESGQPAPARGRGELAVDLNAIAAALDPVGLRWLPTLALNHTPPELEGQGTADELLERIAFRLLTTVFRFGGRRLGARSRGQRLPDAVIRWQSVAALVDCKAAQYGYRMGIDDQRALCEYFQKVRDEEDAAGFELRYIVVISGEFAGEEGGRHPYHERARQLEAECGARLIYLRAADLVRLAVAVEVDEPDPAVREAIAWEQLFDLGMPESKEVTALWPPES